MSIKRSHWRIGLVALSTIALSVSCATTNDTWNPSAAQAQSGSPAAAQVKAVSIPYDPNLPRFVVAVQPLDYSASGQISGGGQAAPASAGGSSTANYTYTVSQNGTVTARATSQAAPNIGKGIAAQLTTALSRCGNISIIDPRALKDNGDGTYSCKLQPGEVGPFIIKGTVTEFSETAQADQKKRGGSLGGVGVATGLIGAITGNRDVAAVGTGVAVANPTMVKGDAKRTGMIGMDLQVLDGRRARLVQGFNCSGSFTTVTSVSGVSVFGIGGSDSHFAASALGQATRAAMNDAEQKTMNALKVAPR